MKEFTSYIVYRKEWAIKWFIYLAISMSLLSISAFYFKSQLLSILFFVVFLAPIIFIKQILNFFTRKALLRIGTDVISFEIVSLKEQQTERKMEYSFFDIIDYNIKFPTYRFVTLTLHMKSGKKNEFSFLRKPVTSGQSDTDEVIHSIHLAFSQFKKSNPEADSLVFKPSFFASKPGLITILFLAVLLITSIGITIHLNKNIPATFLGSAILLGQLLIRRASDLRFYKKMKGDQPKSNP